MKNLSPTLLNRKAFAELFSNIDNVLLDCDGVLWNGAQMKSIINNAHLVVNKLMDIGKRVFLVTNNSTRSQSAFAEHVSSLGFKCNQESLISATNIMALYLKEKAFSKKIYVVGSQGLADELSAAGFECVGPSLEVVEGSFYEAVETNKLGVDPDVGAIAVGFDPHFNYGKLVKACCYLADPECLFLGSNIDVKYPVGNTRYHLPAGGVMVKSIECASGREATVIGKPSKLMFQVLSSKYKLVPERTLMIGDTLHTDMVFGNGCGMKTLLVLSGVSSLSDVRKLTDEREQSVASDMLPDYYIESLGDVWQFM